MGLSNPAYIAIQDEGIGLSIKAVLNFTGAGVTASVNASVIDVTITGSGSAAWVDLTDTPANYTDQGGKLVAVNGGEDGLEFVAAGAGDLLADGSVPLTAPWDMGGFYVRALQFISDIAAGAPFVVSSTTNVSNLSVDLLDGHHAAAFVLITDLEDTPTEDEADKAPTSEWAFDHNAKAATDAVQGHATAAQITKLDAIEALADVTSTNETSHADVLVDGDIGVTVADVSHAMSTHSDEDTYNISTSGTLASTGGLAADLPLGEFALTYDAALSADATYSGHAVAGTSGEAFTAGDLIFMHTDGKWYEVDCSVEAEAKAMWAISATSPGGADVAIVALLPGTFIRYTAWAIAAGNDGLPVFGTATPGAISLTAPTTTAHFVRVAGYAWSTSEDDIIYFNPSGVWVEI